MQTITKEPKAEEKAKTTKKEMPAVNPGVRLNDVDYLLYLQGTAGNRAVQRYLGGGGPPQISRQSDPKDNTVDNANGVSVLDPQLSSSQGSAPGSSTSASQNNTEANAASQVSAQTPPDVWTGDNLNRVSVFNPGAGDGQNDSAQSTGSQVSVQTPPGVWTGDNLNGVSKPPPPTPKLPDWYNFNKNGSALPGEPVAGGAIMDTSSQQMRRRILLDKLVQRNEENFRNTSHFTSAYASIFLEVWGDYVGDLMAEAAKKEEKSFWSGLASFVVRASLVALFTVPVLGQLADAGMAVALLYETLPVDAGEAWESHQEHQQQEGKVEQTQGKMIRETVAIAGQMQQTIAFALRQLAGGYLYTQWLEEAPQDQLNRFRLPPLFPYKTEGEITTAVAQSIAGGLPRGAGAKEKSGKEGEQDQRDNLITLTVDGSLMDGKIYGNTGPFYKGPEALGERLNGQPLGAMPNVPLSINLVVNNTILYLNPTQEELEAANSGSTKLFYQAFPSKPPMKITRQPNGQVTWSGGGLGEYLFLNIIAGTGDITTLRDYEKLVRKGMLSPKTVVEFFLEAMTRGMQKGIELLIQQQLNPLTVFVNRTGEDSSLDTADVVVQAPIEEPERKPEPLPEPSIPLATPQGTLPGEPVPGSADWKPPYSQDFRKFLLNALLLRNEQNSVNGPLFAARYASAFLKTWVDYITDEVVDEVEDESSFFSELLTFVVSASISALFTGPFEEELKEAGLAINLIYKDTPELAGNLTKNYQEGRESDEKTERRKAELAAETAAFARQLEEAISQVVQPLSSGFLYTQWLEEASLDDLGKFRLPPLIPDKSEGEIETAVAQAMVGYLNEKNVCSTIESDNSITNLITMNLDMTGPGQVKPESGPFFQGSKALGERLNGKPIAVMPNVPLHIILTSSFYNELHTLTTDQDNADDQRNLDRIQIISNDWPGEPEMFITRDTDGHIDFHDGGMTVWFNVYQIANTDPSTNPYSLVKDYAGMLYHGLQPEGAAREMMAQMKPGIPAGIKKLLKEQVANLTVKIY